MRKSYLTWLISAVLLALFLTACGGGSDEQAGGEQEEAEEAGEATERAVSVHGDTINSSQVEDAVCVVNSRFEKGQMLVFRASVVDVLADEAIEDAEVKVVLETGDEFEMEYGPHGEEETMLYAHPWTIPDDFVTGTVNYEIVATVDGVDYTYEPFDVGPSKLTVIEASGDASADESEEG